MKLFEIKRIGGTNKWLVVELWEGGTVRGPFFSEEEALKKEQSVGQEKEWSNLQKV